ncbi:hypothetical protein CKG00_11255 [Morganella morganii]|uniref:Uncharacterized protein n=1 Tax=Morganella morganii TaxID=582 RepID=A0A433ZXR3_MORMO|nr:hypothetical protein CKG00_11255 [Morganella morganii]
MDLCKYASLYSDANVRCDGRGFYQFTQREYSPYAEKSRLNGKILTKKMIFHFPQREMPRFLYREFTIQPH